MTEIIGTPITPGTETTPEEITEPTNAEILTLYKKELKRRLMGGGVQNYTIGGRSAGTSVECMSDSELRAGIREYELIVAKETAVSSRRSSRTLASFGRPR